MSVWIPSKKQRVGVFLFGYLLYIPHNLIFTIVLFRSVHYTYKKCHVDMTIKCSKRSHFGRMFAGEQPFPLFLAITHPPLPPPGVLQTIISPKYSEMRLAFSFWRSFPKRLRTINGSHREGAGNVEGQRLQLPCLEEISQ